MLSLHPHHGPLSTINLHFHLDALNSSILRAGFSEKASFILGVFLSEVSIVQKFIGLFLKPCNSVGKPKEATVGSTHAAEVLQKCSAVKSSDI